VLKSKVFLGNLWKPAIVFEQNTAIKEGDIVKRTGSMWMFM
jgi:hypothetical protein